MAYQTLEVSQEGGVLRITLDRPEAANALSLELGRELMQAAIQADEDPSVRAVLLTGRGRMFCAGGDLKLFESRLDAVGALIKELTVYFHAAISRFLRMQPPLVVAVNGAAAGAGMSLAIAGDLVIAAASSRFTMAYTAAGLAPDGSSSYVLPRLVGLRRAQELMLTNRTLSAEEALAWGLVTQVVPDASLAAEAEALAARLADGPTQAYGSVKRLLATTFAEGLETQMEYESREIARLAAGADGREGITAFVGKRRPVFHGQ